MALSYIDFKMVESSSSSESKLRAVEKTWRIPHSSNSSESSLSGSPPQKRPKIEESLYITPKALKVAQQTQDYIFQDGSNISTLSLFKDWVENTTFIFRDAEGDIEKEVTAEIIF